MNGLFKNAKKDKIIKWSMSIASILLLGETLVLALFYLSLPPFMPLFNQLPWGDARLGQRPAMFLPVLIASAFLVCNFLLANHVYEKMPLVSRILSLTSFLIAVLSLIFTLQTLRVIV